MTEAPKLPDRLDVHVMPGPELPWSTDSLSKTHNVKVTYGDDVCPAASVVVHFVKAPTCSVERWELRLRRTVAELQRTRTAMQKTPDFNLFRASAYRTKGKELEIAAATTGIAVAVTCHDRYMDVLLRCLKAVDAQTLQPDERYLALDGCTLNDDQQVYADTHGWTVNSDSWKSPNPGRQWALHTTKCPWLWYVDADDEHLPGYLEGAAKYTDRADVGIIQADRKAPNKTTVTPANTDYWALRLNNYVDTSAVWRVDSLKAAGGWYDTERFDDWDCALRVTARGWHTVRNAVPSLCTVHADRGNRNERTPDNPHKWSRSYAVVALLAGRLDCWDDWTASLLNAEYPDDTRFYIVDNSRSDSFNQRVRGLVAELTKRYPAALFKFDDVFVDLNYVSKHEHVARLYNRILPKVTEDLVLFWEDDVIPFSKNPVRDIVKHWDCLTVGGICAMYPSRDVPDHVMGSPAHDYWHDVPLLSQVRGKVMDNFGFIPGGFALFQNAFVRKALPFSARWPGGWLQGWDGQLSRCVRDSGWKLVLDGALECEHRTRK